MSRENLLLFPKKLLVFIRWPFNLIIFVSVTMNAVLIGLGLYYKVPKTLEEILNHSEVYLTCLWAIIFFYTMMSQSENMSDIIETSNFFDIETMDPENKSKASDVVEIVSTVKLIFPLSLIPITAIFVAHSLITGEPMFYIEVPDHLKDITVMAQCVNIWALATSAATFNTFFICICGTIVSQIRLLGYVAGEIVSENAETTSLSLKELVAYHNYLLGILNRVRKIYSSQFVVLYGCTVLILCSEMYLTTLRSVEVMEELKRLAASASMVIQLGDYCYFSQFVESELQMLAHAVYNAKWYDVKNTKEIKHFTTLCIMRSQKSFLFTAGNLIDMDLKLFASVMKLAYSIFTLLRSTS